MLFGGRYYVTFDSVAYTFQGSCSYLLTSDFLDHNFTLAVSYDSRFKKARELIVLVNNTIVKINVLNKVSLLNDFKEMSRKVFISDGKCGREREYETTCSDWGCRFVSRIGCYYSGKSIRVYSGVQFEVRYLLTASFR